MKIAHSQEENLLIKSHRKSIQQINKIDPNITKLADQNLFSDESLQNKFDNISRLTSPKNPSIDLEKTIILSKDFHINVKCSDFSKKAKQSKYELIIDDDISRKSVPIGKMKNLQESPTPTEVIKTKIQRNFLSPQHFKLNTRNEESQVMLDRMRINELIDLAKKSRGNITKNHDSISKIKPNNHDQSKKSILSNYPKTDIQNSIHEKLTKMNNSAESSEVGDITEEKNTKLPVLCNGKLFQKSESVSTLQRSLDFLKEASADLGIIITTDKNNNSKIKPISRLSCVAEILHRIQKKERDSKVDLNSLFKRANEIADQFYRIKTRFQPLTLLEQSEMGSGSSTDRKRYVAPGRK